MKITRLLIVLAIFSVNLKAQKIKKEILNYKKITKPTLFELQKPLNLNIHIVSSSDFVLGNLKSMHFQVPDYINNNPSTPDYIALINLVYASPVLENEEYMGKNKILIQSNISGDLYLIKVGKGVFDKAVIVAQKPGDRGDNSASISKRVSLEEVHKYLYNGTFPHPDSVLIVEKKQMEMIVQKACGLVNEKLAAVEENERIPYNYLKPKDDFDGSDFMKAYDIVKKNINPTNADKLKEANAIFQKEYDKYENSEDKKIVKYKTAILRNIINNKYMMNDYSNADELIDRVKNLNKRFYTDWFTDAHKAYQKHLKDSKLGQPFSYTPVPDEFIRVSQRPKLLTMSGNIEDLTIDKTHFFFQGAFNFKPVFKVSQLSYALKLLKEGELDEKNKNIIFDNVLWYILYPYKSDVEKLKRDARKAVAEFSSFVKELKKEIDSGNLYDALESKEVKQLKNREYFFSKYKVEDLTKFIDFTDNAIELSINNFEENELLLVAYEHAIQLNAITQTQKILDDITFYEEERKMHEGIVDKQFEKYLKKWSKLSLKGEVYYEFKKSVMIFENRTKSGRELSLDECRNYEELLNDIMQKIHHLI